MSDWFASVVSGQYATAIMWTLGALVLLLVVLLLVRLARGLRSGTFVAGGRNRRPRLAVTDATAVDSTRRLVLVRCDDAEHLLLVGGPSDIVVEQNIKPAGARPQPANTETARPRQQRDKAAAEAAAGAVTGAKAMTMPSPVPPQPEPTAPSPAVQSGQPRREPASQPVRTPSRDSAPTPATANASAPESGIPPRSAPPTSPEPSPAAPATPGPEPRPEPANATSPGPAHAATPTPTAHAPSPPQSAQDADNSDDPLTDDLEPQPESAHGHGRQQAGKGSLEDEMSRLLEDISDERR